MSNTILYIVIIVIIICLILSSIGIYFYYSKTEQSGGINVDGVWLVTDSSRVGQGSGLGPGSGPLIFTDTGSDTVQFIDNSNSKYYLGRNMTVRSRTANKFDATFQDLQGMISTFVSNDGKTGIFTTQIVPNGPIIRHTFNKT